MQVVGRTRESTANVEPSSWQIVQRGNVVLLSKSKEGGEQGEGLVSACVREHRDVTRK